MGDWRVRPTLLEEWDESFDTILSLDENGTSELEGIRRNLFKYVFSGNDLDDRWFTVTGVLMNRSDFLKFKEDILQLKKKHWPEGLYDYKNGTKRVVLHSREIRKKEGPFSPKNISYSTFMDDLTSFISDTPFTIYSSSINKVDHIIKYSNPYPVYSLCLEFVLERYCRQLKRDNKTGALWLESRGKREDIELLSYVTNLIDNGNRYFSKENFDCIKGVYFNPKWDKQSNGQMSHILLELADLVSFPIHKYVRSNNKDQAYRVIEKKIYNYPCVDGYGLKKFP